MHYGQMVQSHALHFFHLASPDLLLGFDSEPTRRNIVGVAMDHPEIATQGVLLRKYGQEVIRHTAGKRIHGTGAIPGGVNKGLTIAERDELRRDIPQMIEWARGAVKMLEKLHLTNPNFYNRFGELPSNMMGFVERRRRNGPLSRRLARPRRAGRRDLRSRGLRPIQRGVAGRGQILVLHEVSAHQVAGRGERLVQGRARSPACRSATAFPAKWRKPSART